jgi:Bacterial SH3 domain/N-acetylmuramoyl-L-alanine amidase
MAWRGIVGKAFTVPEFEKYVGSLTFGVWRPRFIVVHNTSVPDRKTWDGWQARKPPLTDEMWGQNLERYYKGLGWSGCPHLVVTPRSILVLNPLTTAGTHSPAWNSISWGVETVGEFDRDPFTGSIKDNLVAALAILHAAAGLQLVPYERGVRGLHFHKEDPKTTHKSCPGRNMVKSDLIKGVQAEIERRNGGEHPADEGGNFGLVKTAPGDLLNLRETPSAKARVVTTLNNGARVTVLGGKDVGPSRWLNVTAAGKSGWVATRYVDITWRLAPFIFMFGVRYYLLPRARTSVARSRRRSSLLLHYRRQRRPTDRVPALWHPVFAGSPQCSGAPVFLSETLSWIRSRAIPQPRECQSR